LRRLVEQFGLGQNAPAHRNGSVGGEDVGAFEFVVDVHHAERGLRLVARQSRRVSARQLAALGRLVDVGGAERVGFDADLINEREPARRAGSKHQFRAADHLNRYVIRRFVRSYGVISTSTLSPASTRMRFLRMRPAVCAMISCSFSSLTRKVAFGSSSVTTPGNSNSSSFAIRFPKNRLSPRL